MTVEKLRDRILNLQKGLASLDEDARRVDSDRHATSGAIQEAQFWLQGLLAEHARTHDPLMAKDVEPDLLPFPIA